MTSSVYNYVNDAKVWLPMTAACHDATNLRTLDKSGNGLHYRFGDGATSTTYPTKLSGRRGYSFDGLSDYLEALANQTNAITAATWAWFGSTTGTADQDVVSHFDATITRALILISSNNVVFYAGDLTNFCSGTAQAYKNYPLFIAGTTKVGDTRKLYVNGIGPFVNAIGTLAPGAPTTLPRLGVRYNNSRYASGNTYWYGHWEYALSELQLRDLEQRLRRQLNDV